MAIPRLRRVRSDDDALRQAQDASDAIFQIITSKAILDGRLIQNVTIGSTVTAINHGLSRNLIGWILIRKRADESVWDEQDNNTTPARTLILQASASVSVDLWVF